MGKGAFAKCYEFLDKETNLVYAGKVVPKALLMHSRQKEKITQEIQIHKSLSHKHVVGFHGYFEDEKNVYIILELCKRQSLLEMHRRRRRLTEPEVRYFLRQLLLACQYLVQQRVIHRDLKLGNLLLNDGMELKVGDFGLSTRIDYAGERKKTLCGTPNYIAPEVLAKKGHSFEVDVWSIGCILFTMLAGHPPFETPTLKDTYIRIRKNDYHIPPTVSFHARALIRKMLQPQPEKRPVIEAIMEDDFFTCGTLPSRLPTSCLVTEPRFDTLNITLTTDGRRPLSEKNEGSRLGAKLTPISRDYLQKEAQPAESLEPQKLPAQGAEPVPDADAAVSSRPAQRSGQREAHLEELQCLLRRLFNARPPEHSFEHPDEVEDPASTPVFWVSKWMDYTEKYGMAYQLCDNSIGVLFNDNTRGILLSNNVNVTYVDKDGFESYHTMEQYPPSLEKKVSLLKYFNDYMSQHLASTGQDSRPRDGDNLVRLPCLGLWLRTRQAICFYLTNGTVQLNFHQDHTKIFLCPLMAAVSYIDSKRVFHTYRLETLQQGCPPDLMSRLKYARTVLDRLATVSS